MYNIIQDGLHAYPDITVDITATDPVCILAHSVDESGARDTFTGDI